MKKRDRKGIVNSLSGYSAVGIKKPVNFAKNPIKKEETEIEVQCMNCMKMIPMDLVAEHSEKCVQVKTEIRLIEQCSLVQQADYKIRRLKESLTRLSKDSTLLGQRPNNSYYLRMVQAYAEDILKIIDFTKSDIVKCREIAADLNTLLKGFNGSSTIYISLLRLLALSKEKYTQLSNYYKEISAKSEDEKSRDELRILAQQKAELLRKSINNVTQMRNTLNANCKKGSNLLGYEKPSPIYSKITSDRGYYDDLPEVERKSAASETAFSN